MRSSFARYTLAGTRSDLSVAIVPGEPRDDGPGFTSFITRIASKRPWTFVVEEVGHVEDAAKTKTKPKAKPKHVTASPSSIALAATLASLVLVVPRIAAACGTSGPDGVSACSLAEHSEETRPRWRLGLSGVTTATSLHFSNDLHADETRSAAVVSLSYAPTRTLSVAAEVGAAVGGRLTLPDGVHTFSAGPTAGLGASWRVVEGRPFVVLTSLLSFTGARTHSDGTTATVAYDAFDLRLGAVVGTTLWNAVSPYALARAFGGPIYWTYQGHSVTGTDTHHYQFGAGLAVLVARRADLFVEGVPLGERALAGGFSFSF